MTDITIVKYLIVHLLSTIIFLHFNVAGKTVQILTGKQRGGGAVGMILSLYSIRL